MKHFKSKTELIVMIACVIATIAIVALQVRIKTADFVPTISIIALTCFMALVVVYLIYIDKSKKEKTWIET